jgi:hypothetical protein
MDPYLTIAVLIAIIIGGICYLVYLEYQNQEKFKDVLTLFTNLTEEDRDLGKIHFWRGERNGRKVAIRQKAGFGFGPRFTVLVDCDVPFDFDLFARPVLWRSFETKILYSENGVITIGMRIPSDSSMVLALDRWLSKPEVQNALFTLFNDTNADSITTYKFEGPLNTRISASAYWSNINKERVLTMLTALFELADSFESSQSITLDDQVSVPVNADSYRL